MTLTQLEYLVAVDTYRNFGIAAEKCMITQPTLSMQLKKLEEELGIRLLNRNKHPVVPTNIGRLVIEQARVILRESAKVEQLVMDHRKLVSGVMNIGIIPTIAPYLLPYFLGPFTRNYPEVHLNVMELKTGEIVSMLQKDLIDAGILATPLHEPYVSEQPLYYEEIMLYVNPSHRLYSEETIMPGQLRPEDMWMLTKGNCFRDHVINLCELRRENPLQNLQYESGSLETLKKMVDIEGGYTLLPELAVLEMPAKEHKRVRRFAEPRPLREVSLVFTRSAAKWSLLERLTSVIQDQLPKDIQDKSRGHLVEWK